MRTTRLLTPFLAVAIVGGCSPVDAEESARIVEALALEPGMTVADVGAGDGEWALELSEAVGPDGVVYATEIEEDLVEQLRTLGLDDVRGNITAVLGDERTTGLDAGCCDAILLRMVYHHFTDPKSMRDSLFQALVPGGRIAVIDIVPQTGWGEVDGVPDRGGHGVPIEDVVAEMIGDGFELESVHPDWRSGDEDRFCVVFRRPAEPSDVVD